MTTNERKLIRDYLCAKDHTQAVVIPYLSSEARHSQNYEKSFDIAFLFVVIKAVADPGFAIGGVDLVEGWAPNPEAVKSQKFCMSKRKNIDP